MGEALRNGRVQPTHPPSSVSKSKMVKQLVIGSRAGGLNLARRTTARCGAGVARRQTTKCGDTQVIMTLVNGAVLFLVRTAFMPAIRNNTAAQGLPLQNDQTYVDAGDDRAVEANVFETRDPAGFTLIDTMAWGSLGHVLGFAVLAAKNANDLGVVVSPHW